MSITNIYFKLILIPHANPNNSVAMPCIVRKWEVGNGRCLMLMELCGLDRRHFSTFFHYLFVKINPKNKIKHGINKHFLLPSRLHDPNMES